MVADMLAKLLRAGCAAAIAASTIFMSSCAYLQLGNDHTASPNLKFGVLSDIHINDNGKREHVYGGDTYYFRKALEYFKTNDVDAVVIAGDIADRGKTNELMDVARTWFEVFPEGSKVVKLFVSGNHDWSGQRDVAKIKALWEEAWREPYSSPWHKEVKGYHFVGVHWENTGYKEIAGWLAENGDIVRGDKPFFYIQHPHPKDTCNGTYAWGRDGGTVTKTLADWPNAVVFSGHSHYSQLDERSIWQGAFTSINTGSLRYGALPDDGGLPGRGYENGSKKFDDKLLGLYNTLETKSGLLVEVYNDKIVYCRRDFQNDCELGPDWVQTLPMRPDAPSMGFAERAAKEMPPAFSPDAAISTAEITARPRKGENVAALEISFPAAIYAETRPFTYEIRITGEEKEDKTVVREVLATGFDQQVDNPRVKEISKVPVAIDQLPAGKCTIEVTPVSALGVRGAPIKGSWR